MKLAKVMAIVIVLAMTATGFSALTPEVVAAGPVKWHMHVDQQGDSGLDLVFNSVANHAGPSDEALDVADDTVDAMIAEWETAALAADTDVSGTWTFSLDMWEDDDVIEGAVYAKVYADTTLFHTTGDETLTDIANDNTSGGTTVSWTSVVPHPTIVSSGEQIIVEYWFDATAGGSGGGSGTININATAATENLVTGTDAGGDQDDMGYVTDAGASNSFSESATSSPSIGYLYDSQIGTWDSDFSTGWETVMTIPSGSLSANTDYFLFLSMGLRTSGTSTESLTRVTSEGSNIYYNAKETTSSTFSMAQQDHFDVITTDGTPTDIVVQVDNPSNIVTVMNSYIYLIDLTLLTQNDDWFFSESTSTVGVPTSWTGMGSSVTLSTADGSRDWLVFGGIKYNAATSTQQMEYELYDGSSQIMYGSEEAEDSSSTEEITHSLFRTVDNVPASTTFSVRAKSPTSTNYDKLRSAVFALNLDAFESHDSSYASSAGTALPNGDVFGTVDTLSYTPTTAGNQFVFNKWTSTSSAFSTYRSNEIQVGGTTVPTGWDSTSATPLIYGMGLHDVTDRSLNSVVGVTSMSGATTITARGTCSGTNTISWYESAITAFSTKLATGAAGNMMDVRWTYDLAEGADTTELYVDASLGAGDDDITIQMSNTGAFSGEEVNVTTLSAGGSVDTSYSISPTYDNTVYVRAFLADEGGTTVQTLDIDKLYFVTNFTALGTGESITEGTDTGGAQGDMGPGNDGTTNDFDETAAGAPNIDYLYDSQIGTWDSDFSTGWETVMTIPSGSLSANTDYFLFLSMGLRTSGTSTESLTRVTSEGSNIYYNAKETTSSTFSMAQQDHFDVITTDGTPTDIVVQVDNPSNIVTVMNSYIYLIDLTLLTQNDDWFFSESTSTVGVPTSWTGMGSSVTLSTADGSRDWLVFGGIKYNAATSTQQMEYELYDGSSQIMYGSEEAEDSSSTEEITHSLFRTVDNVPASTTFSVRAKSPTSTNYDKLRSAVFALNLDAFESHDSSYASSAGTALPNGDVFGTVDTLSYTPTTAGNQFVFNKWTSTSSAFSTYRSNEIQVGGTTVPTGWDSTSAAPGPTIYGMGLHDVTDRSLNSVVGVASMSGATTITARGTCSGTNTISWYESSITSFSTKLATGGATNELDVEWQYSLDRGVDPTELYIDATWSAGDDTVAFQISETGAWGGEEWTVDSISSAGGSINQAYSVGLNYTDPTYVRVFVTTTGGTTTQSLDIDQLFFQAGGGGGPYQIHIGYDSTGLGMDSWVQIPLAAPDTLEPIHTGTRWTLFSLSVFNTTANLTADDVFTAVTADGGTPQIMTWWEPGVGYHSYTGSTGDFEVKIGRAYWLYLDGGGSAADIDLYGLDRTDYEAWDLVNGDGPGGDGTADGKLTVPIVAGEYNLLGWFNDTTVPVSTFINTVNDGYAGGTRGLVAYWDNSLGEYGNVAVQLSGGFTSQTWNVAPETGYWTGINTATSVTY